MSDKLIPIQITETLYSELCWLTDHYYAIGIQEFTEQCIKIGIDKMWEPLEIADEWYLND